MKEVKAVLSIAGSDPSGGAGIQADLKTFSAIGVYGCAAITCLTVQNTTGVFGLLPVEADFVRQQAAAVLCDLTVTHIKTGMMGGAEIMRAVGEVLAVFTGEIICDPVIKASDGAYLLGQGGLDLFQELVLSRATVLTPNIMELEMLSNRSCRGEEDALAAGRLLLKKFPRLRALVVKGGHLDEEVETIKDYLLYRPQADASPQLRMSSRSRIRTINTHGTGCTFAAAFAAFHQLYDDDVSAFEQTTCFMDRLLRQSASFKIGQGRGPLLHHLGNRNQSELLNPDS